jgi:hypothetical protein
MSDESNTSLIDQLEEVITTGTEAEAKAFVIAHLKEFPEETQRELAVGLFAEALEKSVAEHEELERIKETAGAAIDEFEEEAKQ